MDSRTSETISASKGVVLSPCLFGPLRHDGSARSNAKQIFKYADDMKVLIQNNDEPEILEQSAGLNVVQLAQPPRKCGENERDSG